MNFFYSLKNKTLPLLSILLLFAAMSACTKENNGIQPDVPAMTTMVMEFDDSITGGKTASSTKGNHNAAALQIGVWNVILTLNLAIPVSAFSAITNESPNFVEGTWMWDKDFNVGLIGHNARLEGTVVGQNVQWEMYISKDNAYSDFLWFTGTSAIGNQSGQWLLNTSPNNSTPLLQIDWEVNNAGTTQISYTNIIPGHKDNGGFIEYGITENNAAYDAFYTIYHTDDNFQVDIEWNRNTKEGRIRNANFFSDDSWYCWSSSFQNVDCE
ncbi:MAG: hypothetical protein AB8B69_03585 [Chitinophagales bacterium]